jgi:purine-binding chemotaxis protein CheW
MTASTANIAQAGKFLSFRLGSDEYGVEILKVQEIVGGSGLSGVPGAPAPMRGLYGLRGRDIPVVDLRTCLNLPRGVESEKTCIIVAEMVRGGRTVPVGLMVDEVCEVLNIREDEIHFPPLGGGGMEETDFINGLGRLDGRDIVLVDVQQLLDGDDLDAIDVLGC